MENIRIYPLCTQMAASQAGRRHRRDRQWHSSCGIYIYACLEGELSPNCCHISISCIWLPKLSSWHGIRSEIRTCSNMQMNMLKEVFIHTHIHIYIYTGSTYRSSTHTFAIWIFAWILYCACVCAFWGHKTLWWLHKILKNLISKFSCCHAHTSSSHCPPP